MAKKGKTHKGLAKRVKISAKGKVRHKRAGGSHLMSSMSPKRRRKMHRKGEITGAQAKMIRMALNNRT